MEEDLGGINVLIVEDERDLADLYAEWLKEDYDVRVAYGGREGLEKLDESIDVVLLDRRMPEMSGDEVLDGIEEVTVECKVAMVTAVEPDYDVLEMGFDDYVEKPLDKQELVEVVERIGEIDAASPSIQEYFSLVSKLNALESQKPMRELQDHPEYKNLNEKITEFGETVVSLAEEVLSNETSGLTRSDRSRLERELREWEERAAALSETDPLYQQAANKIQELESDLGTGEQEVKQRFLRVVEAGFVAEGFWLDPTVQRALNMVFHGKHDDTLVVNRQPIAEAAEQGGTIKFDASQRVRELAKNELSNSG